MKFWSYLVLFPTLGKYLCQKGIIEVFPKAPFIFVEKVVNEVINKRRTKEEVIFIKLKK